MSEFDRYRFSEDLAVGKAEALPDVETTCVKFRHRYFQITPQVAPSIYSQFQSVLERFSVAEAKVFLFVENDHSIQASCTRMDDEACVLLLSSGIVNSFDDAEMRFVLGHELGHHIFKHGSKFRKNAEFLWLSRAAEISSDRLGFLAAGGIEPAVRAIFKTLSGLDSKFLRFDPRGFVSQLEASRDLRKDAARSTHPSFPLRARALLNFSAYQNPSPAEMRIIDSRVSRDMERFIDKGARFKLSELRFNLMIWKAVVILSSEGLPGEQILSVLLANVGDRVLPVSADFFDDELSYIASESQRRFRILEGEIQEEFPSLSVVAIEEAVGRAYDITLEFQGDRN